MIKAKFSRDVGIAPDVLELKFGSVWRAFWGEHYAFICISIYLFWEYVKPEQQYPIFGLVPVLRISILGALLGFVVERGAKIRISGLGVLMLIFLLHCIVSSINAYDRSLSFDFLNLIYIWVLVYFLIQGIVRTEQRLFIFVLIYFVSNFRMSQFGFISWVSRGFSFASYGVTGAGWYRNSGEFGLLMAMFFSYTVCFVVFLRHYWTGWVKWIMYFLPLSAVACIMASSSRGAMIGGLGSLLYLSFFSKKKIRAWLASALLGCGVFFMLPQEFLARFQTAGTDRSSLSRIYYWSKARIMMDEHPILGVGYYNWVPYFRDNYFDPSYSGRVELTHNTFLQTGAELGYVGLGIFVLMVLWSFVINWRSERMSRKPGFEFLRAFAMGMNAAGVGLVIASLFLTATYIPSYWIHFAFSSCLYAIVKKKIEDGAQLGI